MSQCAPCWSKKMEKSRIRIPRRLSLEERVEYAVQDAVRRALDKQRKTQERELDTLSDALQRSLAALAGERDRALRALASEEDKKRKMVDDLMGLLGEELTAGDATRLAMSLEMLESEEQTPHEAGDKVAVQADPYGRAWVLQRLRQCLHARAAAQEHLRALNIGLTDDEFEADEFIGVGTNHKDPAPDVLPVCLGGDSRAAQAGMPLGVAGARTAASQALMTSLNHARSRVEHLEKLIAEVGGGPMSERCDDGRSDSGSKPEQGCPSSHGHDRAESNGPRGCVDNAQNDGGVCRGPGLVSKPSAGVDEPEGSAAAKCAPRESIEDNHGEPKSCQLDQDAATVPAGGDGGKGDEPSSNSTDRVAATSPVSRGETKEKEGVRGAHVASGGMQAVRDRNSPGYLLDKRVLGRQGFGIRGARDDGLSTFGTATKSEEAKLWRMASMRAEASLADLHDTLGDVLALSFRCGEEHARQQASSQESSTNTDAEGRPTLRGEQDEAEGDITGERGDMQEAVGAPLQQCSDFSVEGAGGHMVGSWCQGEHGGRCASCHVRARAIRDLLASLEEKSLHQSKDVAKMEASLELLRAELLRGARSEGVSPAVAGLPGKPDSSPMAVPRAQVNAAQPAPSASVSFSASGGASRRRETRREGGEQGEDEAREEAEVGNSDEGTGEGGRRDLSSSVSSVRANLASGASGAGGGNGGDSPRGFRRDVRTEWQELEGLDVSPAFFGGIGGVGGSGGLGSPMVQSILDRWIDVGKRRILEGWLAHVLHGGPVDAANGCFVPRVQISSLSKEVRDGLVSVVLPLLLHRRGVLLQVLTRERVELVHDIQIRVTPVTGRRDAPLNARVAAARRRAPIGEREHGARIRDMVMKAAHAGYVEEDEPGGDIRAWTSLGSVDLLSRQLRDTWDRFNSNFANVAERGVGVKDPSAIGGPLPEYG